MPKHNLAIKRTIHFLLVSILLSAFFMSVPAQPARADTYEVINTHNSGPGSLRQAITDANSNPGADTITFAPAINGTPIVLSGAADEDANAIGDLDILDGGDLTIQGNGAANTIIDGGGIDRVFHVCPGGSCANTVTLSDMTIRNGSVAINGGGIFNVAGTTTVDGSTVRDNTAGYGGGIYNQAMLNVQNSTIGAGNKADYSGGGIYNQAGTTTVDGSTVSDNTAGSGGGIHNRATLNVQNGSTIGGAGTGNTANSGGGINNAAGTTTVNGSTINGNTADWGGAIYNLATLNVQNSIIGGTGAGNTATNQGGGIYTQAGTATVDHSTVSANTADYGAGIYNEATLNVQNGSIIGGTGAGNTAYHGGGIYNVAGTTTVSDSTVSANTAFWGGGMYTLAGITTFINSTFSDNSADQSGGIGNDGTLTISNSTFSGNTATGIGGGIDNYNGVLTISNSTLSGNSAATGGGINNSSSGTLHLKNNVVANSPSGGDCVNLASTLATNVNNLIEDGSCSPDFTGDPLLGPLTTNGGPTETMALLLGSTAIDAGDNPTCESTDQRGWSRPIDGDLDGTADCDIGAYEKTIDLFLPLISR